MGPDAEQGLRGRMLTGEPMARHTAWGIGGPAERMYEPADADDLAAFLSGLPADEPVFWVGLGSNLLVRDGGLDGTVIHVGAGLDRIERVGADGLRVLAGTPCPKVARHAVRFGLCGAEFLAGIPGSMGGALAMNAGAFGGETWPLVREVETIDRGGRRRRRPPLAFRVGYRNVEGPEGEWFLGAELGLEADGDGSAAARVRALLERRAATQPLRQRTCGSVFRNPPGDHAARLIERCGLKGLRIGHALISERHANFIVNEGGARAADVEELMATAVEKVERECGVRLVPEVRVVGRPPGRCPEAGA